MKLALVCLLVAGCSSLSPAQDLSPPLGKSVNVQRLLKFSGILTDASPRLPGRLSLHFAMYNEPYGGEAYWQETQDVMPDPKGHYTVLLGERTPGGLPGDIFETGRAPWLGVQASQQLEQSRVLLVEMPATWKPDMVSLHESNNVGATGTSPTERYITLALLAMFLVGVALAGIEVTNWWRARTERNRIPSFNGRSVASPERFQLRRVAQTQWLFVADGLRSIKRRFRQPILGIGNLQTSVQSIKDEPPTKAA